MEIFEYLLNLFFFSPYIAENTVMIRSVAIAFKF